MMNTTYWEQFQNYDWERIKTRIYSVTSDEVKRSLVKSKKTVDDFLVMLSPAAAPFLEQMANLSRQLTQQRFGKTILLYAPMYLSNECQNICTYCGFSLTNKMPRRTLLDNEIEREAAFLKQKGVDHLLLVSGEAHVKVGIDYFLNAIQILKPHFSNLSFEVQPLSEEEYVKMHSAGVHSVLVYQETYHQEVYKKYHPKGKKSNFRFRLETPDRIGAAGIHKIGLGVLLGLEDWRVDSVFNALHIDYLQKKYWRTKYSVSFPRLRPAEGVGEPNFMMNDRDLLQLICAYRIWNNELEISISTRENQQFRNHVISLGATTMSAESRTNPGGYAVEPESLEQFEIDDNRSMETIRELIQNKGYEAVMKDWETCF